MPKAPKQRVKDLPKSTSCPRCLKAFQSISSVLNHMNQPYSRFKEEYDLRLLQQPPVPIAALSTASNLTGTSMSETEAEGPTGDETHMPMFDDNNPGQSAENEANHIPASPAPQPPAPLPHFEPSNGAGSFIVREHPTAGATFGRGETFMDLFHADQYSSARESNPFYPFASEADWEVAEFLARSPLTMAGIDEFIKLRLIQGASLSFESAKSLRSRIELLPQTAPLWRYKKWDTSIPIKKGPLVLYYRDPIDCLQSLLRSPLIKDHINFKPFQLFDSAREIMRVYTEWLSGNRAWSMQDQLPEGATLIGTLLSSDKTTMSSATGNHEAHPLLISIANLKMDFRMKASNNAFLLLALIPIPDFIHRAKRIQGVYRDRLYHECLNYVLEPVKVAARIGVMMTDPLGWRRWCFTPLAAHIVDTPESTMIAGVLKSQSSVTTASEAQFGDSYRHNPRTASTTIATLNAVSSLASPDNVETYFNQARLKGYNGVHSLFWLDWPLSCPSYFLTPEPLHHWHKAFWDHDAKWCINVVGDSEIDFRFSILHVLTGYRHFGSGISKVKQVTGREHREIQRHIVAVIIDAVPKDFLVAIRALMDFRYLGQSLQISDDTRHTMDQALQEFHSKKHAIIEAGGRQGKNGTIDNWHIPKLEFKQSVTANIQANGVPMQWSADVTERAHIVMVKEPVDRGNNRNHESQICRHLDRDEKRRAFILATAITTAGVNFSAPLPLEGSSQQSSSVPPDTQPTNCLSSTSDLLQKIDPVTQLSGTTRHNADYFEKASIDASTLGQPQPLRTFSVLGSTAFHLTRDPSSKRMSIEQVAAKYQLPDLYAALVDYTYNRLANRSYTTTIGGRRTATHYTRNLPFSQLEVWERFRIQKKTYHPPHSVLPSKAVNAFPPPGDEIPGTTTSSAKPPLSEEAKAWKHGRRDVVIANIDPAKTWPTSGLPGHQVVEICLIFRIVPPENHRLPLDNFLTYVRRFDVVPQVNESFSGSRAHGQYPEPVSSLYLLKRAKRANGELIGDILPLNQVRELVELIPRFGDKADRRLTKFNSLQSCQMFWLNKYFTKEIYFALDSGRKLAE